LSPRFPLWVKPTGTLMTLRVVPGVLRLGVGESRALQTTGTFASGTSLDLSGSGFGVDYLPSNALVASVNSAGVITGRSSGVASITVHYRGKRELVLVEVGRDSPVPPPGPFLRSKEIPRFEFKVRISSGDGKAVLGRKEEPCIAETLCVSGSVPGRSEVFLRMVGPKPNGYIWPTLVKFSTSSVDIWVRQTESGELKYYHLEGAKPKGDELPGIFDRLGFRANTVSSNSQEGFAETSIQYSSGPPTGPYFTSSHFPDFRFKVRIRPGTGEDQAVRKEDRCIEETLCLSGAIPGRAELFLRIVGPKPNGHLWPTLVRFSTSEIEVWVEQLSTGKTQYYRLPPATTENGEIPGLFDRTGFLP